MAVQQVPYDDGTPLDPPSGLAAGAAGMPRVQQLPVADDIEPDKPASPQLSAPPAATPAPAPFSRPMPNPWDSLWGGVKSFINAGPAPLIDPMVSGALGTDASVADKSNHYIKAPPDAQAIFGETMRVPDERSMVPLRDPETGKLAVYYRTPEAAQGRLTSVASAVAPFLATSGPPGAAALASRAIAPTVNAAAGVFNKVGIGSGETRGVAAIRRAIEDGSAGGGPDALDIAGQLINRNGKQPLTIADVGGPEVLGLLGQASRVPGPGRTAAETFLFNRDAGAGVRQVGDVNDALGGERTAFRTAADLTKARSTAASPLYEEAFAANPSIQSKDIDRVLETPAGKQALASARVKMQNDQSLMGIPDAELGAAAREQGITGTGGVAAGLRLRTLDYVKRSLDDQIGTAITSGNRDDARILTGLKKQLVTALDEADVTGRAGPNSLKPEGGAYARARAAYSGPSASLQAVDDGKNIFNMEPEEIAQKMAELPEGDKQFFRLGAESAIRQRIGKTGLAGDESRALLKDAQTQQQLRPLFNSQEAFDKLIGTAKDERLMKRTLTKTFGNSETAGRLAQDAHGGGGLVTPAAEAIAAFGAHEPMVGVKAAGSAVQNLLGRLTGMTPQVADRIQSLLLDPTLSGDPARLYRALLPQPRALNLSLAPGPAVIPQGLLGGPAVPQGLLAPPSASR